MKPNLFWKPFRILEIEEKTIDMKKELKFGTDIKNCRPPIEEKLSISFCRESVICYQWITLRGHFNCGNSIEYSLIEINFAMLVSAS